MKVALLTYSTKPRGGVVHTLYLAEALADLGVDVTVWTLGRGGDGGFFRAVDPSVRIKIVPFPEVDGEEVGSRILRSIEVLGEAFTPAAYDIVHAQDCISANAVGRCIRTVHHLDTFTTPELAACHERAIVEPYAHICVSSSVAAELRDGWGIPATVIANGVDAARFAAAASDDPVAVARRSSWTNRLGRYVLAVGGIEPRKGTLDLLEAYALLPRIDRSLADVSLVIAGGETLFDYRDYRAQFDRRAVELGVQPVLLGVVNDDDLPALVAASSLLSFVSNKEGFGLAAMEALAARVPVVVRDLPVLHEVFDGAATFAVNPSSMADAIARRLTQADPSLEEGGVRLAGRHSWTDAAVRHVDVYRRLAAGGPATPR